MPGLAEHTLFGQHHVQNLVAGVGVGIVQLHGTLGLVQVLFLGRIGVQAAQVSDLHFQLVALAVDDLHVLPGDLVLLALALIQ